MSVSLPHILVHAGFASSRRWHVEGYVIKKYKFVHSREHKRWFTPLNVYRSYTLRPLEGLSVKIVFNKEIYQVTTNELGYFMFDYPYENECPEKLEIEVLGSTRVTVDLDRVEDHQTIVVSDIDDTILVSHAKEVFKKLYVLLFKRSKDRKQVKNMSSFYRSLKNDKRAHFFYLTNSEWNLYPIINYFLKEEGFPTGSLFMNWLKPHVKKIQFKNHLHKRDYLELLVKFFPDNPFVLIGDSGQKDPQVYLDFVSQHPTKVASIGLRVMKRGLNEKRLEQMFQPFLTKGGVLNLFNHGSHLKSQKW